MNYGMNQEDYRMPNLQQPPMQGGMNPQQFAMPNMQQPNIPQPQIRPQMRPPMQGNMNPNAPAQPDPRMMLQQMAQPPIAPQGMAPQQQPDMNSAVQMGANVANDMARRPVPVTPNSMMNPQEQPNFEGTPTSIDQGKLAAVAEAMPQEAQKMGLQSEEMGAKPISQGEVKAIDPYTEKQMSDKPQDKLDSIDMLAKAASGTAKKMAPGMKEDLDEINNKYSLGEIEGEQVYTCPLSNKPCSQKTFWQRLKEFFLHSVGMKSQEEKDAAILELDNQDSIVQKYGKGTEGQSIPRPEEKQSQQPQGMGLQSNDQFTPLEQPPMFKSPYGQQQPNPQEEQFNPNRLPIPPVTNGVDYNNYNEGIA